MMEDNLMSDSADKHRIGRDYAFARLELMESTDLLGYSLQDVNEIANEFHGSQIALVSTLSSAERASELKISSQFELKVKSIKYRLQKLNTSIEQKPTVPVSSSIKLPRINIKPFDGNIENWVSFIQLFDSLIHNKDISQVEKLHYLLSSVQGNAYDLIKNYPLSEENYELAYNTLKGHYDKKRVIATIFYEKLLNCEPIKSKNSIELSRINKTFKENLDILSKYHLPDSNFMLFYLLWSKLDVSTKEAFELQLDVKGDIPRFSELCNFIDQRSQALENSHFNLNVNNYNKINKKPKVLVVSSVENCGICHGDSHKIAQCPQFLNLTPFQRFSKIKDLRLCIGCFQGSHTVKECRVNSFCKQCKNRHHDLLHFDKIEVTDQSLSNQKPVTLAVSGCDTQVLFSTAIVLIKNKFGRLTRIRILIDSASACNFITSSCAHRLGLHFNNNSKQSVRGIGQISADTLGSVHCEIFPSSGEKSGKLSLVAFVLPNICSEMPTGHVDSSSWIHIKNLKLADPDFGKPGPIDMLLNVNIFAAILQPGIIKGEEGQPVVIHTTFGWIVMGECAIESCPSRYPNSCVATQPCLFVSNAYLDASIKRFWELENIETPKPLILSKCELLCEKYMEASFCKNPDGRMIVPLTFKDTNERPQFSNSRDIAMKRLINLEKKFKLNSQFYIAYVTFMEDYLQCSHMIQVNPPSTSDGNFYYIPHHGVLRPDSVTTPLRVVFDASAKDAGGRSLNEELLPGPKLQRNIFELLLRFRWHAVVFTADIKQMYRQFLVRPDDCNYQRILWRPSCNESVKDYKLLTVTYGVSCAPYQALWCINKLSKESSSCAKQGSTVLARDTYINDVVSGADCLETAQCIRHQLVQILSSAGLHLRKWASNCQPFLDELLDTDLYMESDRIFTDENVSLKILDLSWFPKNDTFNFITQLNDYRCTKRNILSDIARIFDPLGLLSPLVFFAKYLIQLLWMSGVDWDSQVPVAIAEEWCKFKTQLSSLESLSIPRRIIENFVSIQLHGFCDASEKGYCAVIYCRVVSNDGTVSVRLCCAKSKVAPIRKRSIPRLELLAAVLLSELTVSFKESLKDLFVFDDTYAWSDSTVSLSWIRSCPSRWKTFVANRVSDIQERIAPQHWHHIAGYGNPADCGSRGLLPAELVQNVLWWAGPPWLVNSPETWPQSEFTFDKTASDEPRIFSLFTGSNMQFVDKLLERYSSFDKLLHVLAYCFRFVTNIKFSNSRLIGSLSVNEIKYALYFLVKHVQERSFASELRCLSKKGSCTLLKAMRKLAPFIDERGLLRVGGRLSKGDLSYDVKHPILLPRDHRLTVLIIDNYHQRFMHPGLNTLQNLIAQEFWILSSKRAIHKVISYCVKCFRVRPKVSAPPFMGNLPEFRIRKLKAFASAAVDYAGPFDISLGRGRGLRTFKAYVCVFVCTSTKAMHFELVSELTSEAFIAGLCRFIARRGRCSMLISDQGKNFVGAAKIINELMENASQAKQIKFVFNPPGSPHFSGLAESGVKSMKTHLYRVIGSQRLTYEEFYTVLSQIESMLNSRPLLPLSSDPNDFSVLTPGHFLTQEPLTILPETDLVDTHISYRQRWKLLQKIHQDFWRKWHLEYLHTLQARHKWFDKQRNIAVGTLVLIVNEQCSPMKWKTGRVVQLHSGTDGICRVVTVRTATGNFKRPVAKLCPLPIDCQEY